jgi:hypothetical protein
VEKGNLVRTPHGAVLSYVAAVPVGTHMSDFPDVPVNAHWQLSSSFFLRDWPTRY